MERELTQPQREILQAVYYEGKTQKQVAQERGVSCSTVCRTLHRAEARLRRFLRYEREKGVISCDITPSSLAKKSLWTF